VPVEESSLIIVPAQVKHGISADKDSRLVVMFIADIYKARWQIETFFRWIKQNLKNKEFIGNSKNKVMTQVFVDMIAYLLLCCLKFLSDIPVTFQNLIMEIQLNLLRKLSFMGAILPSENKSDNAIYNNQLRLELA
jgi:putative transposase